MVEVLMLAFLVEAVAFDNLVVKEVPILVGLDSLYTKHQITDSVEVANKTRTHEDPSLVDNQRLRDLKHTKDPKTELQRANDQAL